MTEMAEEFMQALTAATTGEGEDESGGSTGATALQQQVDEIREQKNEEIRRLRAERDDLQARVDDPRRLAGTAS